MAIVVAIFVIKTCLVNIVLSTSIHTKIMNTLLSYCAMVFTMNGTDQCSGFSMSITLIFIVKKVLFIVPSRCRLE